MLLPVPHHRQTNSADCLAACAAMVLAYIGRPIAYEQILTLMRIGPIGSPRRNIVHLASNAINVAYREANISLLIETIQHGLPIIVFVDTGELPYWTSVTNHAVVVIGIQDDQIIVNDPAFNEGPFTFRQAILN